MCLAQGHNAVKPVRLEPAAPQSKAKHSTTEPLRSLFNPGGLLSLAILGANGLMGETRKGIINTHLNIDNWYRLHFLVFPQSSA